MALGLMLSGTSAQVQGDAVKPINYNTGIALVFILHSPGQNGIWEKFYHFGEKWSKKYF